jgi:ParB family chromosome partitioning protein
MANKLADRLLSKTANVAKAVAENPGKSISEQLPVTMPGQLGAFRLEAKKYQDRINQLESELKIAKEQGGSADIPLEDIQEVAGRRRKLSSQQYQELKENLRTNTLVTPITVRRRAEGGFEIISGNNRAAIFRELGRTHIPARLLDSDDRQAEINAFYANLLQPDLPDYEKYQGFKKIMASHGNITHAEIAQGAGVSRSFVSQLMAFEELPIEVLRILDDQPALLGANAAQDFASLVKKGRATEVIQAVERLASGLVDQAKAIREAASDKKKDSGRSKAQALKIRSGKANYCGLIRAEKTLRIQFQSDEEAELMLNVIRQMLEARAQEVK